MHDENDFDEKLQKFSVVKKCPRCGQLSMSFKGNAIRCTNCGYEQGMPTMR